MILFTKDIAEALAAYLASKNYDKTYLVADTNTRQHCLPLLEGIPALRDAPCITIEAGDIHKDIAQVAQIWQHLSDGGASRHSLLINLGGGMVTDLGGFAGATFKRGLHTPSGHPSTPPWAARRASTLAASKTRSAPSTSPTA